MSFKEWFRNSPNRPDDQLEVEDLITLERYDEAEARLQDTLAGNPRDLRAQQRLADLYLRTGQAVRGAELLTSVADALARDGFYDRAIALLSQVRRLDPAEAEVAHRIERLQRTKQLEGLRQMATLELGRAAERGGSRLSPILRATAERGETHQA